jgi:ribosomal protein L40E
MTIDPVWVCGECGSRYATDPYLCRNCGSIAVKEERPAEEKPEVEGGVQDGNDHTKA